MCNVIDTKTGWKVDLIVRKEPPFILEEFTTAEDTVLAKLEWRARSDSERQCRLIRRFPRPADEDC